jgi:glycosyltransferase involved in cell wall biosynthesis
VRILQVTPYFAPAWAYGGPPRVMFDYAVGLAALGHQVDVLTTDVLDAEHRATPAVEVMDGVRVRRLPNVSNSLAWRTKKYLPRGLVRRLGREIADYDAVHVTDTRTYLTAAAYVAARARGVPFCLSAHGSLPGSAGLRGVVKRAYDAVFVRPMLEQAALLLAQTDHEAELYRHFGGSPDAIKLLPLPLDLDEIDGAPVSGALHRLAGLDDAVRVILFLGRIHWLKGLDILIEAVAPLLDGGKTALVIVGRDDGQWGELARRYAGLVDSGGIRFVGPLYDRERFPAYADADVFCLTPRHWEETSVAALEAAACGTAVVVTEQSDIPGLSTSGGGFVAKLDPDAIRSAVVAALEHPEMGALAAAHVRAQHAKEVVVARLEKYVEEAVARRYAARAGRRR